MNILQIVARLDKSDIAKDVIRSTRFLTLNGHKAVVASGKSDRIRKIDELGARHYTLILRPNIFSVIADIFRLSHIISKENIAIVHAKDAVSSFVAFFAARFKECTFISTIYEYEKRNFFTKSQVWAKRIICFSESETRRFANDGALLQDKVRLIPPFVDENYPAEKKLRPENLAGHFIIGALLPLPAPETTENFIKATSILIRSANRIKVFIMNKGPSPGRDTEEKIRLLIKRHSLVGVVTLLSEEEEGQLISDMDLFVQVNLDKHVLARPLLEASSRGIPILTTRADWITDYVEDNKTAVVSEPGSHQDMASKMLELYKNKELRYEITGAAKVFVKEKFDIKKMMEATLRLYEEARSSKNILIIKIGALGDVILAIPSIRGIRAKFPTAKIKLLTAIDKREIFVNSPFINEIIVCDFKERDKGALGLLRIARSLRSENFDITVDLQNNKKSHILAFLSCAPKRYGYDNGKLSILLNRKAIDAGSPMDPVSHQSRVLGLLDIYNIDKRLEIWPSREDDRWVEEFLESHWIKDNTRLVAINISSSEKWVTKLWPVEYFAEVSNRIASNFGARSILIGLPSDSARTEEFFKRAKGKPINALGKTNVPRLAALVKRCNVLVSSDSAPLHIASSVNTPYIALFGPTDPKRHIVPTKKSLVFQKGFKCSPCYHASCKRDYQCMRAIKPDEVCEAIARLLK